MNPKQLTQDLQNKLHKEILPTKTLNFQVQDLNKHSLSLTAPLELNINDKGTAFGGSIASLCTITGWSLCWVLSKINSLNSDIVIHKSEMEYLRPVTKDFLATVNFPKEEEVQELILSLKKRKKASLYLEVEISENQKPCVKYYGKYVFILKD